MFAKEIPCPNCQKGCLISDGLRHDEDNNLLCGHCSKVIFAATVDAEKKVKKSDWSRKEPMPIKQGIGEIPYERTGSKDNVMGFGGYSFC